MNDPKSICEWIALVGITGSSKKEEEEGMKLGRNYWEVGVVGTGEGNGSIYYI